MGYPKEHFAVVTGGSKGIGAEIVKRFLDDGIRGVALLGRNPATLEETAQKLDPTGARTLAVPCDVSDPDKVEAAFASISESFGRVDILVNNAGVTDDSMFHKMSAGQFTQIMDIHVMGAFRCIKQIVDGMRTRAYGRIINISSIAAFGNVGQANYSAAKAALIGFTRTLALELGPKNITVNCVAPGLVNTDIIKTVPEAVMRELVSGIPLKRIGEPAEVAGLVSFLAGRDSSYITGQCIRCSGGK
jgi:3-oxoacyl-[acyl-carrier protein] reductase